MDRTILCVSNSYEQKYFLEPRFERLPSSIKEELKIMSVFFTEDNGGILTIGFDEDGYIFMETLAHDYDYLFDEIGSALVARRMQKEKAELFEALEKYYRIVFMGLEEDFDD